MSGQPTRAGLPPEATDNRLVDRLPLEWRKFGAFLRNPTLPDRADLSLSGTAHALPWLYGLDLLLMALVLGAIGLAAALGLEMPQHMLDGIKLTPLLIGFIVIGAPIGEEVLFRSWLSGRPGHLVAVAGLIAGGAAMILAADPIVKFAGMAAGILLAIAAPLFLRRRDALLWFQRHFRWFYYASALAFAAMHLTNFAGTGGPSPSQLPLVLPQLLLGLLLGYVRVNRGLAAGVALHMMHNALFAAMMLAGAS